MCTTYAINGSRLFGQNYDFYFGHGYVVLNPSGINKFTLLDPMQKTLRWTSRYASLTFNQFGCEFPIGGMNEKGLVVAMMFDEDGDFPPKPLSSGLNELQWIQYQLDNFGSIEEVYANVESTLPFAQFMPLHYSLADSTGRSLVMECVEGRPVIHQYQTYHVLTNTNHKKTIQAAQLPFIQPIASERDISVARYRLLAQALSSINDKVTVQQAFHLLDKVAFTNQSDNIGYQWMTQQDTENSYTYWSIVYDLEQLTIYLKTRDKPELKVLSLQSIVDRYRNRQMLDINTSATGDLTDKFSPFNLAWNQKMVEQSYLSVASDLTPEIINRISRYPMSFAA
ncbi:MAG: linear amide C-N hydrolase [Neisseria sp.]|uniref:linear amide C-N hydrolase n=1 Tax=Neisseria sp. TaxID=192066 RepID=UPI0026DAE717|nr:linear amide C-N hydrolase [Neisseria sp.]MDO4640254.1 linear amide C-N hydrolase [Neisseria sp.]